MEELGAHILSLVRYKTNLGHLILWPIYQEAGFYPGQRGIAAIQG
jgi:hypothetical protein